MPWINEKDCVICGICVEKCPVGAILLENEKVRIEMSKCIRCGICHQVCPQDAVKHDSEKVGELIEANVQTAQRNRAACKKHLGNKEGEECLERTIKHFKREQKIAEETVKRLQALVNN